MAEARDPFSALESLSVGLKIPDLWQQEAVRALRDGRDVIVDAPTGAGKTHIFELFVESGATRGQSVYTVPTRALANDKRAEWRRRGWETGIATGDLAEQTNARVLVATLETQRERLIRGEGPGLLVIDEYQLIGDPTRGLNYELAVALAPPSTRLLLLSGSVANPDDVARWLRRLGRDPAVVRVAERPVPLEEVPVETLPMAAPRSVKGFWPRTAAEVLMADMGPLLVFAPQRASAERLAQKICAGLPNTDPLDLTREQEQACGRDLARLLRARVAFHHSGLTYGARAGVVEPLARAGQLRVVVATMGLAAGINFSMRSVCVADTRFTDAFGAPRQVASDELLQMFGRAGRRGLDTIGYVIRTREGPGLADASPRRLHRANEIDWPTLLRVMSAATAQGESPFERARETCRALFSEQRIQLGFRGSPAEDSPARGPENADPDPDRPLFGIGPRREEIFNSAGHWEEKDPGRFHRVPLALATVYFRNYLEPALAVSHFVTDAFPVGRLCRLRQEDGFAYYGKELVVARRADDGTFVLSKNTRKRLRRPAEEHFTYDQLESRILPELEPHFHGGSVADILLRDNLFVLRLDFAGVPITAYRDSLGVNLIEAEERSVLVEAPTTIVSADGPAGGHMATRHSPAHAWRRLGLIEADGTPTRRGTIFSFFQRGEGLAVTASLEDPSYAIEEIVLHLANLRAGHRFESYVDSPDDRMATVCRATFGAVDHEGYLSVGLPPGFGLGAAEAVADATGSRSERRRGAAAIDFGAGDIERAVIEWLSLLRHIRHAPDHPWDRWTALKEAAAARLARCGRRTPALHLPAVPSSQLTHKPRHRLSPGQLRH